jgi:hypothetical protein
MSRRSYAKSHVFLMEFIVVVLFFALCTSICISAFVKADNISKQSKEMNHAILLAQSAAEAIKALDYDEFGRLGELIGLYKVDDKKYYGYYTKNFQSIVEGKPVGSMNETLGAVYAMEVKTAVKDQILTSNIMVYSTDATEKKICELEVKKYLPEEV